MRALLLTADPSLGSLFWGSAENLALKPNPIRDSQSISDLLNQGKYEAVLLDADTLFRLSVSYGRVVLVRNAVIFAVATKARDNEEAPQRGAHFLFRRPIDAAEIRRALRSEYDLMIGESRRYFRCKTKLHFGYYSMENIEVWTVCCCRHGTIRAYAKPREYSSTAPRRA